MKSVYLISVGSIGDAVMERLGDIFDWKSLNDYVFHFTSLHKMQYSMSTDNISLLYIVMGSDIIDFKRVYNLIKTFRARYGYLPIGIFHVSEHYRVFKNNYLVREISKFAPFFFVSSGEEVLISDDNRLNFDYMAKTIKYALILDTFVHNTYRHVNISIENSLTSRLINYSSRFNVIKLFFSKSPELIADPLFWGKKIITAINRIDDNIKGMLLHFFVNDEFTEHFTLDYISDLITEIFNQSRLNRLTWNVTFHKNLDDGVVLEVIFS